MSKKAVKSAVELAKPLDARLRLIHVMNWWAPAVPAGMADQLDAQTREFGQLLLNDYRKAPEQAQVMVETVLGTGVPAEEIAKAAGAKDVWMVVVGSHGKGTVQRMFMGSVSTRVLQLVEKPVLVVR
jgi:nucleotide-binding universal stress UspA family protein